MWLEGMGQPWRSPGHTSQRQGVCVCTCARVCAWSHSTVKPHLLQDATCALASVCTDTWPCVFTHVHPQTLSPMPGVDRGPKCACHVSDQCASCSVHIVCVCTDMCARAVPTLVYYDEPHSHADKEFQVNLLCVQACIRTQFTRAVCGRHVRYVWAVASVFLGSAQLHPGPLTTVQASLLENENNDCDRL